MSQIDTNEIKEGPLSKKLIGIAFETYNTLGSGYSEKIYQNVFKEKLEENGLKYQKEVYCNLKYNGKIVGAYRLDFLIEEKIIVEIKSRNEIFKKDTAQVLNYLKFYKLEVGLIFCFGTDGVIIKRLVI